MQALLGLLQQAVKIHGFVLVFQCCRQGLFCTGLWAVGLGSQGEGKEVSK